MAFLDKKSHPYGWLFFFIFGFCLKASLLSFCLKIKAFANFNLQKCYYFFVFRIKRKSYSFAFRIEIRFSLSIVLLEMIAEITTTTRAITISSSATTG